MNPKFPKRNGFKNGSMLAAALMVAALAAPALAWNGSVGNVKATWFETIERYMEGQWSAPVLLLVGSAKEWDAAMATIEAEDGFSVLPRPAAPDVDWSEHAVVLLSLGAFSSGPCTVEIVNVGRAGSRGLLDVVVQLPPELAYQTFVAPYHLIKVERRGLKTVEANYAYQVGAAKAVAAPASAEMAGGPSDEENGLDSQPLTWGSLKAQF